MAKKQVKGCPASLEKCKSKLQKMRYHFTPIRMAITKKKKKKSTNNICWRRCGEKGSLVYCWWECKLIQLLWRTVQRFPYKTRNTWSRNWQPAPVFLPGTCHGQRSLWTVHRVTKSWTELSTHT